MTWTDLVIRIGTSAGIQWTQYWTFRLREMQAVSWLPKDNKLIKKDSTPWS